MSVSEQEVQCFGTTKEERYEHAKNMNVYFEEDETHHYNFMMI